MEWPSQAREEKEKAEREAREAAEEKERQAKAEQKRLEELAKRDPEAAKRAAEEAATKKAAEEKAAAQAAARAEAEAKLATLPKRAKGGAIGIFLSPTSQSFFGLDKCTAEEPYMCVAARSRRVTHTAAACSRHSVRPPRVLAVPRPRAA